MQTQNQSTRSVVNSVKIPTNIAINFRSESEAEPFPNAKVKQHFVLRLGFGKKGAAYRKSKSAYAERELAETYADKVARIRKEADETPKADSLRFLGNLDASDLSELIFLAKLALSEND
jgi:hypothetical protein